MAPGRRGTPRNASAGAGPPELAPVRQNGGVTVATHHEPSPARDGVAQVVTGEAVPLDIRVARLGSRVLALLIDLLVQFVLYLLLLMLFGLLLALLGGAGLADEALLQALLILLAVLVFIGYPTALLTLTRGLTIGKLTLGLRVVRDDGGPIGFRHALTRTLVGAVVEFPGMFMPVIGWGLSIVLMTISPLSKRLGDHTAGTFVIHERNLDAWGWVPAMPPQLATWASTLDLTGLDDELALAVRHYLARNRRLREPARSRLGHRLAQEVAQVTSPPPPPGTPGWAYLAAVHAERHARAMRRLATVRGRAASVWPELAAAIQPPVPQLTSQAVPQPQLTPQPQVAASPMQPPPPPPGSPLVRSAVPQPPPTGQPQYAWPVPPPPSPVPPSPVPPPG